MLELKNLGKTYYNKGGNVVKALTNVNITFDEIGLTFIYGPSGNGKSTLLNILGGIESYDEGEFFVHGIDFKTLTRQDIDRYRSTEIGFVFQDQNLINSLSVAENIRLARSFTGNPPSNAEISEVLKKIGLEGFENRWPEELSGGERQRVSIARTLVESPNVLFVDEPTGHLDQNNSKQIWDILKEISKTTLIIAVSHDREFVDKYADRIITLRAGKVIDDVYHKVQANGKVVVSKTRPEPIEKITRTLKLKQGNMPFKHVYQMAKTNMGIKKFRTAFVILLSSFSLLFFSMFFILSNYNNAQVQANSVIDNNVPYVGFVRSDSASITEEDISQIIRNLGIVPRKLVDVNYSIRFGSGASQHPAHSKFSITGLIETAAPVPNQEGNKNRLGQTIIHGNYPTKANYDAVAISDYVAGLLVKYGYQKLDGTTQTVNSADDLIGKLVFINDKQITIQGIYETDYHKYVNIDTMNFNGFNKEEFEYNLANIYGVIHVPMEHINTYIQAETYVTSSIRLTKYDISLGGVTKNNYAIAMPAGAPSAKYMLTNEYPNLTEALGTSLSKPSQPNNIILPISLFKELVGIEPSSPEDFIFNELGILNLSGYINSHITLQVNNNTPVNYNIVGVTDQDIIIVNEQYFRGSPDSATSGNPIDNIYRMAKFPSKKLLMTVNMSQDELAKTIIDMQEKGYIINTFTSDRIADFSEKIEVFNIALLIASIFTAVFSLMLIFNFIAQTIADRKHDIGILRAIGASNMDVSKIFLLSTAFIAGIIFLITTVLTIGTVIISNTIVAGNMAISFSIFSLTPVVFVWLFLISFGVSVLGAMIPILNFAQKQPIDVIKRF